MEVGSGSREMELELESLVAGTANPRSPSLLSYYNTVIYLCECECEYVRRCSESDHTEILKPGTGFMKD